MKTDVRAQRTGFTLIELLVSMAVMTVGTAALFALQGYVARSNMNSKEMTIATSIAENWIERLKMDALNWTEPGTVGDPGGKLTNTGYLQRINSAENAWDAPPLSYLNQLEHSPGADLTGNEITAWSRNMNVAIGFCTNLRFNWTRPGTLMRADVRVVWPKRPSAAVFATDFPQCIPAGDSLDVDDDGVDDYHAVYASTAIRWTPP